MPEGTNRKTGLTANGAKNAKPKEKPFAVTLGVEPGRIAKTLSVRVKDQALLVVAWVMPGSTTARPTLSAPAPD